ncbi:S1 family peptidase [Kribbella sp. NPDC056861]|uniref:S1 family peptidase n=1 Tax=Kribbella sp. NPDC056861 TaxID=3154857 RepID=UPI00343724E3
MTSRAMIGLASVLLLGFFVSSSERPATAVPTVETSRDAAFSARSGALAAALGLTPEQARTRLRAESAATGLNGMAVKAAGESLAESWFDAGREKLVVGVTTEKAARAVRAIGADAVIVPATRQELDSRMATIDALAAKSVPAAVRSWYADAKTGRVVIEVVRGQRTGVDAFVAGAARGGPVDVREVAESPAGPAAAGVVGGDQIRIGNAGCSIGFSVQGGFVTAGHCTRPGGQVVGWDGSAMGVVRGSSYPGNDYGWVQTGYGWWTTPVVGGWGQVPDTLVRGSADAPVGVSTCKSGYRTHWTCGVIQQKNVSVSVAGGRVDGLTRTNVCIQPGDSGGSVISGDQAQGVVSLYATNGPCVSWFQPVNEILSAYGLRLQLT